MKHRESLGAREVTAILNGRWNIALQSGSACCPAHDDRNPSLSLRDAGDKLLLYCHSGCEFESVIKHINGLIDKTPYRRDGKIVKQIDWEPKTSAFAQEIWEQSYNIKGTPAERYLINRGIKGDLPDTLRYHPSCKHFEHGNSPAMIAKVEGSKEFAIHRTYITLDGRKQPFNIAKTMLGSVSGGAVRLRHNDHAQSLIICEGIETALSLIEMIPNTMINVWAALSTSGMKNVNVPANTTIRKIIVAMDGDNAGRSAGKYLMDKMKNTHFDILSMVAPEGKDFNDMLTTSQQIQSPAAYTKKNNTEVLNMRSDMLPKCIYDFVYEISYNQQSPIDYSAITAIISIGTVIGNSTNIRGKRKGSWLVTPNLWGAIVGEPSTRKTIAMKKALSPLKELQKKKKELWLKDEEERTLEKLQYKLRIRELDKKIDSKLLQELYKQHNDENDGKSAKELYAEKQSVIAKLKRNQPRRFIINNATLESFGDVLQANPLGVLVLNEELSGFISDMGTREKKVERCFYLTGYDGDSDFSWDRVGRGHVEIPQVTLSMLGTIQPSEITHLVQSAMSRQVNDGFLQRLQLSVWPNDKIEKSIWIDEDIDAEIYGGFYKILERACIYSANKHIISLNDEAQSLFADWYVETTNRLKLSSDPAPLISHELKMPDTVLKLSFIFEAADNFHAESVPIEITKESMIMALKWQEYLMSHARKLYHIEDNTD